MATQTVTELEGVWAGSSGSVRSKATASSDGTTTNRPERARGAAASASARGRLGCLEHTSWGVVSRKDVTAGVAAIESQNQGKAVGFVPSCVACNVIHFVVGIIGRKIRRRRRWCAGCGLVYVVVRLLKAVPMGTVNRHRPQPNASRRHGMRCLLTYEMVGRRGCSYSIFGISGIFGTCTRARQRGAEGTVRTVRSSLATSI